MGEYVKRSESVNLKSKAMAEDLKLISSKKRKLYLELENEHCQEELLYISSESDNNESTGEKSLGLPDLEYSEDFDESEISTSISGFFREICPEQGLMHSTSTSNRKSVKAMPDREIAVEKMTSEAELEEFFAVVEKCEQKRFAEKYNYDIVKDVPLEGKYQWVRLHP